eukprot:1027919-Prymnesium_polylepis.1
MARFAQIAVQASSLIFTVLALQYQVEALEVGAQAEAPSKAPPILHARRLHACHIKVEHLDAHQAGSDAHIAVQRLDRARCVGAVVVKLNLLASWSLLRYQVIKIIRSHSLDLCFTSKYGSRVRSCLVPEPLFRTSSHAQRIAKAQYAT